MKTIVSKKFCLLFIMFLAYQVFFIPSYKVQASENTNVSIEKSTSQKRAVIIDYRHQIDFLQQGYSYCLDYSITPTSIVDETGKIIEETAIVNGDAFIASSCTVIYQDLIIPLSTLEKLGAKFEK